MPEPPAHDEADTYLPRGRSVTPERCRRREEVLRQSLWQFDSKLQDQARIIQSL